MTEAEKTHRLVKSMNSSINRLIFHLERLLQESDKNISFDCEDKSYDFSPVEGTTNNERRNEEINEFLNLWVPQIISKTFDPFEEYDPGEWRKFIELAQEIEYKKKE